MSAEDTIRNLLADAEAGDQAKRECIDARVAWARATVDALRKAQEQMDDRCLDAVGRLSEEAFNRLFDREQAKVDAIRAQLDAVIERDEWPRELYFGGI